MPRRRSCGPGSTSRTACRKNRHLGTRLWIVNFEGNPLFSAEVDERMQTLVPEAKIRWLADGAVSRPDLTAEIVRSVTVSERERTEHA